MRKKKRIKKELIDIKDMKAEVKKCYGAYDLLQSQLHHINGTINEIRLLFEEVSACFNELFGEWKNIIEALKK